MSGRRILNIGGENVTVEVRQLSSSAVVDWQDQLTCGHRMLPGGPYVQQVDGGRAWCAVCADQHEIR